MGLRRTVFVLTAIIQITGVPGRLPYSTPLSVPCRP
jgi:hypothetical protein